MVWGTKSRHQRGYGSAWVKVRAKVLERDHGLCQPCRREKRVTLGRAVDHIVSKAKAKQLGWSQARIDHPDNLQTICDPCHAEKTEAEQGKTKRPAPRKIGLDGFPI